MSHSTLPASEPNSTSALGEKPGVLVARKHHLLVRWSHWLNVPILLGLILSGISIYWASPIYRHKPDPTTGNFDVAADIGIWTCSHVPSRRFHGSRFTTCCQAAERMSPKPLTSPGSTVTCFEQTRSTLREILQFDP
jgi:hypothetical protein